MEVKTTLQDLFPECYKSCTECGREMFVNAANRKLCQECRDKHYKFNKEKTKERWRTRHGTVAKNAADGYSVGYGLPVNTSHER
jgi:hypothetical protein